MLSKLLVKIALGVGIPLGSLSLGIMPGSAALVSLENPFIGGTSPTDFILRCTSSNVGVIPVGNVVPCPGGVTLDNVLQGGPGAPGGNVELHSVISPNFDFNEFTTLEGTLNNKSFYARSLTAKDWFDNNNAFTRKFLNDALQVNGFNPVFFQPANFDTLVNTFIERGGPQRFSDPNITYVLADDQTGDLTLGLAGTLNASNLLKQLFAGVVDPALIPDIVQVSEAVYVEYNTPGIFFALGGASPLFQVPTSGQSAVETPFIPGCPGGGATGVFDPLAQCSYSADFQVVDVTGATPQNPFLPDPNIPIPPSGAVTFENITIPDTGPGTIEAIWFDPPAVVGFEFIVTSGPLFSTIELLPRLGSGPGSNEYYILLDDGGPDDCDNFSVDGGTALGGEAFTFASPVRCFLLTGIDEGLGLGPDRYAPGNTNSVPFPVGFTFNGPGTVSFTQTPQVIPEPMTLLGAAVALGFGAQFKRKRSNSQDQ
ncbi:MAG: NF038130 family PEP-CTERM protein [Cyanobacteriota bacterium]|nr:NF038130 family PEP-CTERM protein [Cyanobacteriota bacterium]